MKYTYSFFMLSAINVFSLLAMENSQLQSEAQPESQLSLNCKKFMLLRLDSHSTLNDFRQLKLSRLEIRDLEEDICTLCTIEEAKKEAPSKLMQSPTIMSAIMLTKLNLPYNELTSLPPSFTTLRNLREIDLSDNQFKEFPDVLWLSSQPELVNVDLSNNQIQQLPTTASNLTRLEKLVLHHNGLKGLPENFTLLQNLEKIDVSHNDLTVFPEVLCSLVNLTMIDLGHNQIPEISSAIINLTKLKKFYVARNNITKIPEHMEHLKNNLSAFAIEGNPFNVDSE